MTLATISVVLFNCYATADILMKFLQQCFLYFIVDVIPGQVSVYRTIGPTLVYRSAYIYFHGSFGLLHAQCEDSDFNNRYYRQTLSHNSCLYFFL